MTENNIINLNIKDIPMINLGSQEIEACIKMQDVIYIDSCVNSGRTDYLDIIKEVIKKRLSIEEVPDEAVDSFIEAVLDYDESLIQSYETLDIDDRYERFILAVLTVPKSIAASMKEAINSLQVFGNSISKLNHNVLANIKIPEPIFPTESIKAMLSVSSQVFSRLEATTHFAESIKSALAPLSEIVNNYPFQEMLQNLSKAIQKTAFPSISEERKRELLDSYTQWGVLGWTKIPFMDDATFDIPPGDVKIVNQRIDKTCNLSNMEFVFDELHRLNVKKSDLNEAILNYKEKRYKSCAMILFSLIDAHLIRNQLDEERIGNKQYRQTGNKAASNIMSRIETNLQSRARDKISYGLLFVMLDKVNIAAALAELFHDGEDFMYQSNVINRNMLQHGMLNRPVRRRDCVQLFLALLNLYDLISLSKN